MILCLNSCVHRWASVQRSLVRRLWIYIVTRIVHAIAHLSTIASAIVGYPAQVGTIHTSSAFQFFSSPSPTPRQCDTQLKTTSHSAPATHRPLADSAEIGLLFSTRPARCPLPDSSPHLRRRSRRSRYAPDTCVPPRSLPFPSASSHRRLDGAHHPA